MEETLIECVRSHECLYNNKLELYKNAALKQKAWKEISIELNMTVPECRTKWNLLRNAFVHAISRRKTKTGQGITMKKWKFEEEMSFLLPFVVNRKIISNNSESDDNQNSGHSDEDSNDNDNIIQQKKRKYTKEYGEHYVNVMEARASQSEEKDDIDLFFETMAKTAKRFPRLEQVKLKFDVMKMVHEIEMRLLGSSESSAASSRIYYSEQIFTEG